MRSLSLFSGAGGMDIGVIQAGFDVLACIEIDPFACETLRSAVLRERRETLVIEQDIRGIDPYDLMLQLNIDSGELDLLFGGPPCQSFSQIGKQLSLEDERGLLLFEMVRFAEAFQPKAIMIEQVKGLLSAKDSKGVRRGVLEELILQLHNIGYTLNWKVVLAADYGVPQLRERVFIVGLKNSEKPFNFPEPTHQPHEQSLFNSPTYVTVGDVLFDLRPPSIKNKAEPPEDSHMDVTPAGDRRRIHGVPEGAWLSSQRQLPAEQIQGLTRKDTTKFRRLASNEPSITLRGGEIFFHPTEDRILTPREYMRIHGYPDSYILKGPIRSRSGRVKYLDQHRQVANSVPPPLAKAVATAISRILECQQSSSFLVTV